MNALIDYTEEGVPAAWPAAPADLSAAAAAIDVAVVWSRIEAYITKRWKTRDVVQYVAGPGLYVPTVEPWVFESSDKWEGGAWVPVVLDLAPRGYYLPAGDYKITLTVGDAGDPPPSVMQAYRRLAEYMAETKPEGGASSISDGDFSINRSSNAVARALFYSGAADLLRTFRKGRKA